MSLFTSLLETYEKCKDATGIIQYNDKGEADERKTLLPIFHTTFKSQICVTLDNKGDFIKAERDNRDVTIIIPCTESSSGRSSGISAHPLCDQLDYVGGINSDKTLVYLKGLSEWIECASGSAKTKLNAIYTYVSSGAMIFDLENRDLFRESEYDDDGGSKALNNEKIRKVGVRFAVRVDGDKEPNIWEDKELRQSWIDYIKLQNDSDYDAFDYISGERVGKIASQHPKNVNAMTGNAKLLSCNDTSGFTFRGRFSNQEDAVLIDYEQSQKVHQMLRWLISNYGYNIDTQTIITWAVDVDTSPPVKPYENSINLWAEMESKERDTDKLIKAAVEVDGNYARRLMKLLQGYGSAENIKEHSKKICIAIFDAATTGRMGVTFYQELVKDEYLENIVRWHEETSYFLTSWTREKDETGTEKSILINYIGAPSYDEIIFAVFGKARSGNDAGYNTLKKKIRKQLLECMFGNYAFPKSMVDMAVVRASRPLSYDWDNGRSKDWNRSVNITCALVRKYYKQKDGEEIALILDETRNERDYLYGRLLAVADKLEQTAMYKAGKQDIRATNAVRLMSAFAVKPYHTWGLIYQQLHPYINQLNGAGYYQSVIDSIMEKFGNEYENNKPLSPLYLLGFSAQRRAFINKNDQKDLEDDKNDATK